MLTIIQKTFLRFVRWAGLVWGTWYKRVNYRMDVRRVGKTGIFPS